jgi:hypothetical protein
MAVPWAINRSCPFNEIAEPIRCPGKITLPDEVLCLGTARLVTTFYMYPEPTPSPATTSKI